MTIDTGAPDPARDASLAEIARVHLGFGSLTRHNSDDRDFREVAVWSVRAALGAAYAAGRAAGEAPVPDRAPDASTLRAAQIAGILSEAVMAGEVHVGIQPDAVPLPVAERIAAAVGLGWGDDAPEGFRLAGLMISARARASVRTPGHAALAGAEAALAIAEDALAAGLAGSDEDLPDAVEVLDAVAAALRTALAPRHAAERAAAASSTPAAEVHS